MPNNDTQNSDTLKYVVGDLYPLNVDALYPNPHQVRQHFDEVSIATLAKSIEEDGLLQNITFTESEGTLYIVAGERRWRALKLLKEQGKDIPLTGKYVEGALRKLAFVENLFRENLTAVEFAESLAKPKEETDLTQGALGDLIGLQRTTINGILSIAKMPEEIKDRVRSIPEISRDRLEKISRIKGKNRQRKAVDDFLKQLETKALSKNTTEESRIGISPKRSRGDMALNRIDRITETIGKFAEKEYALRFLAEDRDKIALRLNKVKSKIEEVMAIMATEKESWDMEYLGKRNRNS